MHPWVLCQARLAAATACASVRPCSSASPLGWREGITRWRCRLTAQGTAGGGRVGWGGGQAHIHGLDRRRLRHRRRYAGEIDARVDVRTQSGRRDRRCTPAGSRVAHARRRRHVARGSARTLWRDRIFPWVVRWWRGDIPGRRDPLGCRSAESAPRPLSMHTNEAMYSKVLSGIASPLAPRQPSRVVTGILACVMY